MSGPRGQVAAVSIGRRKGEKKTPVDAVTLVADHGVRDDAHAGPGHRQVSLLAASSIETMKAKGLAVGPGSFAENVTVEGIDLSGVRVGDRLRIGPSLVEVTQIGKECHDRCAIYFQAGDCVMPREGIFTRVLEGGRVAPGDAVEILAS